MRNTVWMDTVTVNGEDLRLAQGIFLSPDDGGTLRGRGGVRPSGTGDLLVQAQGSPNNTVIVNPGRCVVNGDSSISQASYVCTQDIAFSLGPFGDPDRTFDRIDLVVVRVYDKEYIGGSATQSNVEIVPGSPGSSPSAPGVPSNSIVLASVRVVTRPSGGAVIGSGNVSDARTFTAGLGGIIPCTSSSRPGSPFYGMTVYEVDTDLIRTWSTTNSWERIGGRRDPRGVVGRAFWGAGTPYSAAEEVVGTLAVNIEANRVYEITVGAMMETDTDGSRAILGCKDGSISGPLLGRGYGWILKHAGAALIHSTTYVDSLSAGGHTFVVSHDENWTGGQVQVVGGAQGEYGAWLIVKDIGGT